MRSHRLFKTGRLAPILLGSVASLLAVSCSSEISGPTPSVSPDTEGENTATTPGFVCNEQVDTWVALSGSDFSPLVVDTLDKDVETQPDLPDITLTLSSTVEGDSTDEAFTVTLTDVEDDRLKWLSGDQMKFRVSADLELPAGIYDVQVANPNGEVSTATGVFGVLERPVVTGLVPSFLCLADGSREFTVEGDWFLVQGDNYPTVTVGTTEYAPGAAGDCRELGATFGEHTLCKSLTVTLEQGDFEPGVRDVMVSNFSPAACSSSVEEDGSELAIVPPPSVSAIVEELACLAEGERSFTISGSDFVQHGDQTPTVTIGGESYPSTTGACETVTTYGDEFQRCAELSITVPQDSLAPGVHSVVVTNPDPAGCESSEALNLTITPPPSIASVAPEVLCSEQLENTVIITGSDFIVVDGTAPQVSIGGVTHTSTPSQCEPVTSVLNSSVETCTQLTVTVPAGTLPDGPQDVTVTNPDPAGCSSTDTVSVTFVPPPSVLALVPDFTCVENQTVTVELQGTGFLDVGGTLPTVTVGGNDVVVTAISDCTAVAGTTAQSCTTLTVEVAEGTLTDGMHDVVVTNPDPAGCFSEEMIQLETVPAPTVTAVAPDFFCNDTGDQGLTVTGTGFYVVDAATPSVLVDGQLYPGTPGACTDTARTGVQVCTELTMTLPAGTFPVTGPQSLTVINPDPVACTSSNDGDFFIAGPPDITTAQASSLCGGAQFDGMVTLVGTNFLTIDGALPTLTVNGSPLAADSVGGCAAVPSTTATIEACTELRLTIPDTIGDANSTIVVTNPAAASCGSDSITLMPMPTPEIASVTPLRVCDDGGDIQIAGQNFDPNATVTLGTTAATNVVVSADGTTITATFAAGQMAGLYDVRVENPSGCFDTFDQQVRVVPGPTPFYVDPPVVYDGVATQVTVYLSGLFGGSVSEVSIVDTAGTTTVLTNINFDPNKPNTVQAVIPANTLPMGTTFDDYDVIITDDVMCSGMADNLVTIRSDLTVAVDTITPPFGWTQSTTGVTITAKELADLAAGEVQFQATPRAYLNPATPQPGDIATEIRSLQFESATELTGVVPASLPVGTYDLIVVNADGSIGLLDDAFDVTLDPPPVVTAVSPGSWANGDATHAVVIEGENFRMPTVEATCTEQSGTTTVPLVTVVSSTATQIDATVDTTGLAHLSVCYIRVTNTNDGTYVEYAPISVTNPAGNFVSFVAGSTMSAARRDAAMTSGRPTSAARFIYAIGGDDGSVANPHTTVEAAPLDRLGNPGTWFAMPYDLPAGRAHAEAVRVEDFVYLVGGHDGTAPVNTVWRAQVLDPLATPEVTNVEFDIDPNFVGGPAPGVYYYRVAAVLDALDPANPNGETLASEPQPVRVPFQGVDLTLVWSAIPNAAEYRIYRSPSPDVAVGNEELLATVPGTQTSFVDDGTATTTAGEVPMRLGFLGTWHDVGALQTARYAHDVVVAEDPADASKFHIYAVGGHDGTTALSSVEYVTITVNGPGDQTVAAAQLTTAALSEARYELAAVVGTPRNASYLTGTYLYALGGRAAGAGSGFTRRSEVAEVQPGGDLTLFTQVLNMQRDRAGYAAAIANNSIVMVGGQGGTPSSSADKASISATTAPLLDSSSALGSTGALTSRYLMGYVSFEGFLYVAGGIDNTNTTSSTTDYSVLGGTP